MSDEEKLESGQETTEVQDTPSPVVPSASSGDEQTSAPSLDLDNLRSEIGELIKTEFQSFKDKRLSRVDTNTESIERIQRYLNEADGDTQKAARNMQIDDFLSEQGVSQAGVLGRTDAGAEAIRKAEMETTFEATSKEILSGANIAFDDPEYKALVEEYEGRIRNPEHWRTIAQAFADRRTTQQQRQENVTEHAIVGAKSEGASTEETDDDLLEKIEKLLKKPTQNVEEREALIAEARKRGLWK